MRGLNRFIGHIVTATFVLALALPASAEVRLRLGHIGSSQHAIGLGAKEFADSAERLSNGAIKVTLLPGGQLGGELDNIRQIRLGTLDVSVIGSAPMASVEPTFNLTELPFIWNDADAAAKVLSGSIGNRILGLLESKGMKGLAFGSMGPRGILSTKVAIKSPADMKGMKVRIIESALYVRTMRAFGANPVPMSWPEVYTGLQQGAVDALETNYNGMYDSKLYEVARHLAVSNHIFGATTFVINLAKFKSLSPEHQGIIERAAKAGANRVSEVSMKQNLDAIAEMEKRGVTISRPDVRAFRALVDPVYDSFAPTVGADLIKAARDAQK